MWNSLFQKRLVTPAGAGPKQQSKAFLELPGSSRYREQRGCETQKFTSSKSFSCHKPKSSGRSCSTAWVWSRAHWQLMARLGWVFVGVLGSIPSMVPLSHPDSSHVSYIESKEKRVASLSDILSPFPELQDRFRVADYPSILLHYLLHY